MNISLTELCALSRALERAMTAMPNKPRLDVTTQDLEIAILDAAKRGVRDEDSLARRALECVGLDSESLIPSGVSVLLA